MGFFDNIGKTISDASQGVVQKGKEMADIAKLNSQISDEEKKISSVYSQIGKKYEELYKDAPGEEFRDFITDLENARNKIAELKLKIDEVKNAGKTAAASEENIVCPHCNATLPPNSKFCTVCGKSLEEAATSAEEAPASVEEVPVSAEETPASAEEAATSVEEAPACSEDENTISE